MQESTLPAVNIDMKILIKEAQALFEAAAKLTGEKAREVHERGLKILDMALHDTPFSQTGTLIAPSGTAAPAEGNPKVIQLRASAVVTVSGQARGMNAIQRSNAVSAVGLLAGLAMRARNGFGLALSGRERAALEFLQVRTHDLKLAFVFALVIAAVWFAVAYCTVLVTYLLWESMGWKALLVMTLGFAALVAGLLLYARSLFRQGQPAFQGTAFRR